MGVLVRPLLTEKVTSLNEKGKFGFVVSKDANKIQIKNEVEKMFNVTVVSVNTMISPGKKKTRYTKSNIISGRTSSFKKAIVTLKEGDFIDFYNGI